MTKGLTGHSVVSLIKDTKPIHEGFPGGSLVKNLLSMQEILVQSSGWEDPLEKETAAHSGTLAWEIPWTEEPVGLQSMGLHRVGHD